MNDKGANRLRRLICTFANRLHQSHVFETKINFRSIRISNVNLFEPTRETLVPIA